ARILYLGGLEENTFSPDRIAGYRAALEMHGVEFQPDLVSSGPMHREAIERRMADLVGSGLAFSAVFAATDEIAAGALAALSGAGLRVPDDVSVVGYNDDPISSYLSPQLTTVHVPKLDLGRLAARSALHPVEPGSDVAATTEAVTVLGVHIVAR